MVKTDKPGWHTRANRATPGRAERACGAPGVFCANADDPGFLRRVAPRVDIPAAISVCRRGLLGAEAVSDAFCEATYVPLPATEVVSDYWPRGKVSEVV